MLRLFLITLTILFAAITGIVARRIYVDQAALTGHASIYVGSRQVTVERAMIRNPDLREGGAANRLDLVVTWPDFRPAASGEARGNVVLVALEDATQAMRSKEDIDPAQRPVDLYAKFLDLEPHPAPGDLIMRRFRKGTPYEGEELFVATPDESVFSARCPTAQAVGTAADERCLWQSRIRGLEVHTRFSRAHLAQWEQLVAGVHALVPRIARSP